MSRNFRFHCFTGLWSHFRHFVTFVFRSDFLYLVFFVLSIIIEGVSIFSLKKEKKSGVGRMGLGRSRPVDLLNDSDHEHEQYVRERSRERSLSS